MTKGEFIRELERRLSRLPEAEKRDAIEYYNDYFAEAGIADDMVIPTSMEQPEQIAKTILEDYSADAVKEKNKYYYSEDTETTATSSPVQKITSNSTNLAVAIILIVLFSPAILGVVSGVGGTLIGLLVALVAMAISCTIAGIVLIGTAFAASGAAGGMILAGSGLLLIALGIVSAVLTIMYCGRFIPWCVKMCVELYNWAFGKKE